MLAMTHIEGQTPTNSEGGRTPTVSDDEGIITLFQDSDEEYEYESEESDVEDVKVDEEDTKVPESVATNYWNRLGEGHVLNPLTQRVNNRVRVTEPAVTNVNGVDRGNTRVISDWFTNVGTMMGVHKDPTPTFKPKKKSSAYIFQNSKDMMKCDLTVGTTTHHEQSNHEVHMKLHPIDNVKFSLGSGQTLSLSPHYAKWIINDYEPHMWREVGIHIYVMFGNDWSYLSLFKAKGLIEECLSIWKKIKKEVYTTFCEIVLEREFTDVKPVPDSIKTQIDRAMWHGNVKEPYLIGFKAFQNWYESKLIKLVEKKKNDKEKQYELFHHMFNFCGLYTMHNRADVVDIHRLA